MKKLKFDFIPGSNRFQVWKQIILLFLLIAAVLFLHKGYTRTRESALECCSSKHLLYASQIENDIRFRFDLINNVLQLWSNTPGILVLTDVGKQSMKRTLEAHGSYISGVTRIDENGIILHTVPYSEEAIGADLTHQEHIQQLLATHQPVLSDAFMTVQGYWAIAYHMPITDKSGTFRGSLAFLIPFREIFRTLFLQLLSDEEMIPWVLGNDGRILYSLNEDQEGQYFTEAFSDDPGILEVAEAAISGETGYMITEFRTFFEDDFSPTSMISTMLPFRFHETTWVLILSIPESIVMRDISDMSNRWLAGMIAILVLALIYSTLKLRTWVSSTQEKKWKDVAHLRDILARTINQAKEAIIILNEKQEVLYANPATVLITGFGKKDINTSIINLPFLEIKPPIREIRNAVLKNGIWTGRVEGTGGHNRYFKMDLTVSSVIDSDGAVSNFIIIGRDVAVQAEMERRLNEQQKMEAIGQLAGGIAHDFNNLLVGILGYAELLKKHHSGDIEITNATDVIMTAAHRGSQLTKQLLGYARQGKHMISRINLTECIRNVESLLSRTLDQRIEVMLDLEDGIYVTGDSAQLEQVILNLALNAKDAMPDGGLLSFTLRKEIVPGTVLGVDPNIKDIELAVLNVSDTGCGISQEDQEKIFEPFFTTKVEEGTGMGLATVYGIIANHGGWVDVDSEPGKGTTFRIFLPLETSHSTSENETGSANVAFQAVGNTVLLIDDEDVVLRTTTELLTEIGYDVIAVLDGQRAVDIFSSDHDRIDIVMLDLSMPQMDGMECFLKLRDIDPEVKVVLVTGFSRDGRVQKMLDLGVNAFLQKPFRLKEMAAILEELINS